VIWIHLKTRPIKRVELIIWFSRPGFGFYDIQRLLYLVYWFVVIGPKSLFLTVLCRVLQWLFIHTKHIAMFVPNVYSIEIQVDNLKLRSSYSDAKDSFMTL